MRDHTRRKIDQIMMAKMMYGLCNVDFVMQDIKVPTTNKYTPHQGAKEKARRVKQLAREAK
jgi:hypothetical protein